MTGWRRRVDVARLTLFGHKKLDAVTIEDVQRLKRNHEAKSPKGRQQRAGRNERAPKTAVEWEVIERMPCSVKVETATAD